MLGSWERDTGALSALTDRAENAKRKKHFLFLFSTDFVILTASKDGISP